MGNMSGYDKLASFIGLDRGLSIYKRFASLNAKNILYLQAELVNLEAELKNIALEDIRSENPEKEPFPYSVFHLKRSYQIHEYENDQIGHPTQWLKVLEIRQLLKEYSSSFHTSESFIASWEKLLSC